MAFGDEMTYSNLDILEHGGADPFAPATVLHLGERFVVEAPAAMDYQVVLGCLDLGVVPGLTAAWMEEWRRRALAQWWAARYDLPDFASAQRLAYLCHRYRSALTSDLRSSAGVDLGTLWRERRWRTLLDLIDHLPRTSWFASSVANDEEHAKALAETLATRKDEGERTDYGVSLRDWSPEVERLANLEDLVQRLIFVTLGVNGNKPAEPTPAQRPKTATMRAMQSAERLRREQAHRDLVARVLPKKANPPD